jgi:phospholipid/cholesterol/gamma-HCH transport system permease protein
MVNGKALLEGTADGDQLKLAGTGAWTSANARQLESLIDATARRHAAVKGVAIDMAHVERLDTFGAWLLERLVRAFSSRGAATQVVGLKEDYRALMDELHAVNLDPGQQRRPNQIVYALAAVGMSIASVGESLLSMVNMMGALTVALVRVVLNPRRLRLTSTVHQLDNVAWRAVPIMLLITFWSAASSPSRACFTSANSAPTSTSSTWSASSRCVNSAC